MNETAIIVATISGLPVAKSATPTLRRRVVHLQKAAYPDDYEETTILERCQKTIDQLDIINDKLATKSRLQKSDQQQLQRAQSEHTAELSRLTKLLGYDPLGKSRSAKSRRGPIAAEKKFTHLPEKGHILTTCLGDRYEVIGYAMKPRSTHQDLILYVFNDLLVVRSIYSLLGKSLPSGVALCDWQSEKQRPKRVTNKELKKQQRALDHNTPEYAEAQMPGGKRRY